MRKETAKDLWSIYLTHLSNGNTEALIANPNITFCRRIASGEYDVDERPFIRDVYDVRQLAGLWDGREAVTASELFMKALKATKIDRKSIEAITEVLLKCSMMTAYETSSAFLKPFDELKASAKKAKQGQPEEAGFSAGYTDWNASPDAGESAEAQKDESGEEPLPDPEELEDYFEDPEPDEAFDHPDRSPAEIFQLIGKSVHSQDAARRAAAMVVFNHLHGRRSNAVFCGPTGCGKSEIWRTLAREYPGLVRIIDASTLAADGWKGSMHVRDIFSTTSAAELEKNGLIVVLDEADKAFCECRIGASGIDYSAMLQNNLLKMLDGDTLEFAREDSRTPALTVDCSKVSVVMLGAFEDLLANKSSECAAGFGRTGRVKYDYSNTEITGEDLIAAGMRSEIAGRINRITALRPLDADDYSAILKEQLLCDLESRGYGSIEIDDESVKKLSEEAVRSGLGVRFMRSRLLHELDDLVFSDPGAGRYRIRV